MRPQLPLDQKSQPPRPLENTGTECFGLLFIQKIRQLQKCLINGIDFNGGTASRRIDMTLADISP